MARKLASKPKEPRQKDDFSKSKLSSEPARKRSKKDQLFVDRLLIGACKRGEVGEVRQLLKAGADPNYNDTTFGTAIINIMFYAIPEESRREICRLLIDHGADINATEERVGFTALLLAIDYGKTEICKLLIDKGADLDIKDNEGKTALMLAVKKDNLEICRLLVEAGADPRLKDANGLTALSFAERDFSHRKITRLLEPMSKLSYILYEGYVPFVKNLRECTKQ
jgi:ankyrin repeat protein